MRGACLALLAAVTCYHVPLPRATGGVVGGLITAGGGNVVALPCSFSPIHAPSACRTPAVRMEAFSFDPFDRDVFRILMDAQSEARVLGAPAVGTQHLLLAATLQKDDVQASLERAGVTSKGLRDVLKSGKGNIPGLNRLLAATAKDELLPFGKDTERALKATVASSKESGSLRNNELITWRELMLSVLRDEAEDTGAVIILAELDVPLQTAYKEIERGAREMVGAGSRGGTKMKNSTLAQCSIDLTQRARDGELDPLVGREDEVKRCMQILVRRRKNNPVLIGDPGVGKTAIAEGIAQLVVDDKVPARLKGVRILSLELGLLVADTKYRGEFEQRLRDVIDEVTAARDMVLFIDELHTLVGAGAAEGAIDAANLLKPALARGELQCIGATTITEYRKYIEKDAALERRFQPARGSALLDSQPTHTRALPTASLLFALRVCRRSKSRSLRKSRRWTF